MTLYTLDGNLQIVDTLDVKSLIWIERYNRVGSCEVYAPATQRNLNAIKIGYYFKRSDRNTVFLIKRIFISGDPDEGYYITANGYDAKCLLDARINTEVSDFQSNNYQDPAADQLAVFVNSYCLSPLDADREFIRPNGTLLFSTRPPVLGITGDINQQILNLSWGEICRQICGRMGWGYEVVIEPSANPVPFDLAFYITVGTDKSGSVEFSRRFDTLGNSSYEADFTNIGNVIIVNPQNEVINAVYGNATGINREEKYLEVSVSRSMPYKQLKDFFPMGTKQLMQSGANVNFVATDMDIPILSTWHLEQLQAWSIGMISPDGKTYSVSHQLPLGTAENTTVSAITDETMFNVVDIIFDQLLLLAGAEEANHYKAEESATAEPIDTRYKYGTDYNLGDLVKINTEFTDPVIARIVEVLECYDENGYHLEPRTEYTDE